MKKWIVGKQRERNLLVVQQQSVESQPEHQLRRLVQSEDDHLNMENEKLQDERRRQEAQQRFLNQLDFYHPLRPQGNNTDDKVILWPPVCWSVRLSSAFSDGWAHLIFYSV